MFQWLSKRFGKRTSNQRSSSTLLPSPSAPALQRDDDRAPEQTTQAASSKEFFGDSSQPVFPNQVPEDALLEGRELLMGAVAETLSKIPLLSTASQRAYTASQDEGITFDELRAILEQDPSLSISLLQLANSVRYAGTRRVDTLNDALSRVGFGGLRDVLMVAASQKLLRIPGAPEVTSRLQARGSAVAYCSRQVAECLGVDAGPAFTAGLLHDVGWPAAYETGRRISRRLPPAIQTASTQGLLELAAFSHQSVGKRLAEVWNLGPCTISAIGNHHDPMSSPVKGREVTWVVAAALALVDSVSWYPETLVPNIMDHPVIAAVHLSPTQVARLTSTLRNDLELNAAIDAA